MRSRSIERSLVSPKQGIGEFLGVLKVISMLSERSIHCPAATFLPSQLPLHMWKSDRIISLSTRSRHVQR